MRTCKPFVVQGKTRNSKDSQSRKIISSHRSDIIDIASKKSFDCLLCATFRCGFDEEMRKRAFT